MPDGTADHPAETRTGGTFERIKTLGWSGLENFSRQILALLFFFVIVRFLQPHDLGIFSLAVALNAVFGIFIDESIGEALVQKAIVTKADWDTGFTINLAIAAGFLIISVLISGLVAQAFHEPELMYAIPALSVAALIGAFGNIHRAFLSRQLRFRSIAQTTLLSQIAGGVSGIGLAIAGFGYWAQIGNLAIAAATATLIYWFITPWRPQLRIDRATVASRLHYTISAITIRSIYLVRDSAPLVIFGALAGASEVGFLSLALRVARSLGQLFEDLTNRPVLSLLSREQHEVSEFGRVLLGIMTIVGLIAFPAFLGLSEIGQSLIPLVFGPVWTPAGAMLPWVCAVLGGWLLLHIVTVSLRARGLGRLAIFITAPAVLLDVLALVLLAPAGLHWALIGWAARAPLSIPLALYMLRQYLGVSPTQLLQRWAVPMTGTALMVVLLRLLGAANPFGTGLVGLGFAIAAGAALYGVVVLIGTPTLHRRILVLLRPAN